MAADLRVVTGARTGIVAGQRPICDSGTCYARGTRKDGPGRCANTVIPGPRRSAGGTD